MYSAEQDIYTEQEYDIRVYTKQEYNIQYMLCTELEYDT